MGQEEKLQELNDVVHARLRYIKRWNSVGVDVFAGDISITWYNEGNKEMFEKITYPSSILSDVIRKQKNKLLRDIPANELSILKDVIK